jgi:hypothetical protein
VILTDGSKQRLQNALGGYDCRPFQFRVWWVRDYNKINPGTWWRYVTKREVWNPTGGMMETLCVRKDGA